MECPFCQPTILKKESFYEDDFFRAIYNLRPVIKGHCLVIPKRHIEELYQFNEDERKDFISFSNKALFIAGKYSNTNEFDFLLQRGENAGQSIKHLHFHIIPRKKNDALKVAKKEFLQAFQKEENADKLVSEQEMKKIVTELKAIAEKHLSLIENL